MKSLVVSVCITAVTDMAAVSLLVCVLLGSGCSSAGVLLGSSGVLLCYRTPEERQKNTRRTPEEHQKNTRRNARRTQKNPEEGEEHQPPLLIPGDNPTTIWWKNARSLMMAFAIYFFGVFQHPAIPYCDATLRGTKIPWPPIVTKSLYAEWFTLVHCSSPNSLRPG